MDKRKRNLATIGLLTVVSTIMFVFGMYWLMGTPLLKGGMDVTVLLSDGGGLKRSDLVQLQGVQVGNVTHVRLSPAGGVWSGCASTTTWRCPRIPVPWSSVTCSAPTPWNWCPASRMISMSAGDTIRGGATPELSQLATDLSSRVESVLGRADALLSPDAVRDVHATASVLPGGAQELRAAFRSCASRPPRCVGPPSALRAPTPATG
jgi:hypothetical protein